MEGKRHSDRWREDENRVWCKDESATEEDVPRHWSLLMVHLFVFGQVQSVWERDGEWWEKISWMSAQGRGEKKRKWPVNLFFFWLFRAKREFISSNGWGGYCSIFNTSAFEKGKKSQMIQFIYIIIFWQPGKSSTRQKPAKRNNKNKEATACSETRQKQRSKSQTTNEKGKTNKNKEGRSPTSFL